MTVVFHVCCDSFIPAVAKESSVDKVLPQLLVGRWATAQPCVERLIKFQPERLAACLRELCKRKTTAKRTPTAASVDDLVMEELQERSQEMF